MYSGACSRHVILLPDIHGNIVSHLPLLIGSDFRFIQVYRLHMSRCSGLQSHTFTELTKLGFPSLSSWPAQSLVFCQPPWSKSLWCHLPSNVPLDWTHFIVTSEWLSLAHLVVWAQYMLEYHGLHVMGASCGNISPFDAASSALPVFDILHLKGEKQMVKKFLQFLEIALHLIPVLV